MSDRTTIEALIFASPEALSLEKLSEITGMKQGVIKDLVENLNESYEKEKRGFRIRFVAGGYQFFTIPSLSPYIKNLFQKRTQPQLTQASLEVLAVIAIMQPVTKPIVDVIRKIDSRHIIISLLEKGLVTIKGRENKPGRPFLYGTTFKFLQLFGLKDLNELPKADELEQFFEKTNYGPKIEAGENK
ncbi:SMC-Scp complex subunit ScpB [bacterium]|nr:SMC-Scp complex subunit ScpB [bacterium]